MCDFIFGHKEGQYKKHFCLLHCLSAFATPVMLVSDVFSNYFLM